MKCKHLTIIEHTFTIIKQKLNDMIMPCIKGKGEAYCKIECITEVKA